MVSAVSDWLRHALSADIHRQPQPVLRVPVARAILCVACETISEISDACPCGSRQTIPLERVIGKGAAA